MFNKKKWASALVMLLLIAMITGCTSQTTKSGTKITEDTLAIVNGESISISDYHKSFALIEKSYNELYGEDIWTRDINGRTVKQFIEDEVVNTLIEEKLIQEYVAKTGFVADEEKITKIYTDTQELAKEDAELQEFYANNNFDEEYFREQIRTQLVVEEFGRLVKEDVKTDASKLDELYSSYRIRVNASHILLTDEATAQLVLEKVKANEDFAELAAEYSKDPGSAANGGSLDYLPRGGMPPEFEAVAFVLGVGEVSDIVESQFGFHIIKIEDSQTVKDIEEGGADEEEITYYKNLIVGNLSKDAYNAKLNELIASADIQKFLEKISE